MPESMKDFLRSITPDEGADVPPLPSLPPSLEEITLTSEQLEQMQKLEEGLKDFPLVDAIRAMFNAQIVTMKNVIATNNLNINDHAEVQRLVDMTLVLQGIFRAAEHVHGQVPDHDLDLPNMRAVTNFLSEMAVAVGTRYQRKHGPKTGHTDS